MLSKTQQQTYLKFLGYYKGEIDGIEGPLHKAAILKLQKDHFTREEDIDGLYGPDTDILLINAYRVKKYTKNFTLKEFKCDCGGLCTGYPEILNIQLLKNTQSVRTKFGSTTITSGLRCKKYNARLVGSSPTSRHLKGKALDIYLFKTRTLAGRKEVMTYWKKLPKYNYTYCNVNGSHPNMGNAVHVDVD